MVNIVRNLIDHGKQSAADVIKNTSKRAIQKTAEVTCDLIGNKIPDKITRVSKTSPKNNSEKNEEETLRKKFISPELSQKVTDGVRIKKIIDDLKLKKEY